jgi:hypothetical protein
VLTSSILTGDQPVSIESAYIAGTQFNFNINLRYSKPYMNKFSLKIGINPLFSKYFKGMAIDKPYTCDINPSQLTLARMDE